MGSMRSNTGTEARTPLSIDGLNKMDHFGLPEDLTRCERALSSSNGGAARAPLLAELAWYLRERDAARALAIVDECLALLTSASGTNASDGIRSRLDLVVAVRRNLEGKVKEGLALARRSQATFATLGDPVGEGDALIVQYQILVNLGDTTGMARALADAEAALSQADAARRYTVMARTALVQSFADPAAAEARWSGPLASAPAHAGVVAVVRSFLGYVKMTRGACAEALRDLGIAIEACHSSGQAVLSASAMGNTAVAFCNLSDLDQALEWSERALAQAQALDAPLLITRALGQVGITLHAMGRLSAASEFLQQALAAMELLEQRRDRTFLLRSLVHLLVQMEEHERALDLNEEVLQCAKDSHGDMLTLASIDQAAALLGVGRHEEALSLGLQTLEREEHSGNHLYIGDVMRLLASIHRARNAPAPGGSSAPNGAIHYMLGYLDAVSRVEGHTVRHEDLATLSADYEAAGDLANALRYARLAADARTKNQTKQASDLATALQVRHDTERMREEAQHSRMLAAAERERAELLLTANETLERLAAIGRDITANMDLQGLFGTLHRHMDALLDASFIGIWSIEGDALVLLFGREDGEPISAFRLPLDASDSLAVRCARERREFTGGDIERDFELSLVPGTRRMSTAFFAPMLAEDKVIGVLSVQSDKQDAYGEREAQILRTLAAYVAVALTNVSTARELAEARSELEHEKMRGVLVHAGKMVTVGRMASGLVHEIAHPVLTVSLLTDTVGDLLAQERAAGAVGPEADCPRKRAPSPADSPPPGFRSRRTGRSRGASQRGSSAGGQRRSGAVRGAASQRPDRVCRGDRTCHAFVRSRAPGSDLGQPRQQRCPRDLHRTGHRPTCRRGALAAARQRCLPDGP